MRIWDKLFRRASEDNELDDELRFHLEQEAQLRIGPRPIARGSAPVSAAGFRKCNSN
jgi:hypothetical protein